MCDKYHFRLKELIYHNYEDITSIVEYYDELIEDKKENGTKEKAIINELSISDIVRNVKVGKAIDKAVEKPTISNGMKALIAFLGILSFPMIIVLGSLIFALVITVLTLVFTVIFIFGVLFFSGIITIAALIAAMIFSQLPIATGLFALGITLIFTALFAMLLKWSIVALGEITVWFIDIIKRKFKKEVSNNE